MLLVIHFYRKSLFRLLFKFDIAAIVLNGAIGLSSVAPQVGKPYRNIYDNVVITMSTTPKRLENLPNVLHNIWPIVSEVHLNLPYKFRNKDAYCQDSIAKIQFIITNLKIFWYPDDTGPIMKTLPTFQRLNKLYKSHQFHWIVSLDDDVIYDASIIHDIVHLEKDAVYSGTVHKEIFDNGTSMSLIFGVSGIAWPASMVPQLIEAIQDLSSKNGCKYHDDYVHSISLNYFKKKVQQRPWSLQKQKQIQFSDEALLWMNRGLQTEQCLNSQAFITGRRRQNAWEQFLTYVMWD